MNRYLLLYVLVIGGAFAALAAMVVKTGSLIGWW